MTVVAVRCGNYSEIRIWAIYIEIWRHHWFNATSSPSAHVEVDYAYPSTTSYEVWKQDERSH